jgi:methionyl-tRNA formyltransferase
MSRLRIAFMGSPDLGVPCLEALRDAGDMDLVQVLSLGDARRGRRGKTLPTPVGQAALAADLPLRRWERGDRAAVETELAALDLDLIVVIAFARILRPSLLAIPRLGCLNLHASLLPWGRGASPIQQAVLEGLGETGWSAMLMEAGLDTGPVLDRLPIALDPRWNSGHLYAALKECAAPFLLKSIRAYRDGLLEAEVQDDASATYAGKIPGGAGALDWSLPAAELDRRILAYTPAPGAWCRRDGDKLTILEAAPRPELGGEAGSLLPGERGELLVACGEGALSLLRVKPAGKGAMAAADYLNGRPFAANTGLECG